MRKNPLLLSFICLLFLTTIVLPSLTPEEIEIHFCYAPVQVVEGEEFTVRITYDTSCKFGVNNSLVTLSLYGEVVFSAHTDETGVARLRAPQVDQDTTATITAFSDNSIGGDIGYQGISLDVLIRDSYDMISMTAPSSVVEGEDFSVLVMVNNHVLKDAEVWGTWDENTHIRTDANGTAILTAPQVDQTRYHWLYAYKPPYTGDMSLLQIRNVESPPPPPPTQLVISAPSSVLEGNMFNVTITADNNRIADVTVSFAGTTKVTNINGVTWFVAPFVESNKNYSINASKEGFDAAQATIEVQNQGPTPPIESNYGWIVGTITDTASQPLGGTMVCALIGSSSSDCIITNDKGTYSLFVPVGTYVVKASKEGYFTRYTENVVVEKNKETLVNITLEKMENKTIKNPIEYTININAEAGKVVGEVTIQQINGEISTGIVTHYSNTNIFVQSTSANQYTFQVEGPHELSGKLLVFKIENPSPTNEIQVFWDDELATRVSFSQIFDEYAQETTPPVSWTGVTAEDDEGIETQYIIICSHFSVHTLDILFIPAILPTDELSQFNTLTMAIAFGVIVLAAIIMFRRNKQG